MKYVKRLLCIAAFPVMAQAQPLPVAPGVPAGLASYRSSVIHQLQYTLDFDLRASAGQPIPATETIQFYLSNNTQSLALDFKAMPAAVTHLLVNGKPVLIDLRNEHIVLDKQFLKRGNNLVALRFSAGPGSLNRNADYLYTLLVPEKARNVFPCFDQPDLKAVFHLSLQLPLSWKAIANGPLRDSVCTAAGKTYRFLASDTISTYLFAFVAGDFNEAVQTFGQHTIHGLYRETDTAKLRTSLPAIFQIQYNALRFMEDYTQIPFPFRRFNFAAIPDFQFGGMEHPGAIDYNASSLFLEESATKDQLNARSNLLSHETAHMWFGDLVTMRWFNDVWMKEVFANFMADKIANLNFTDNNYALKFLVDHYPAAYSVDRTQGTHPIRQELDNLKDAGSLYGNIIYHKAPIMMRQLELLIGADSLQAGLREYLHTYAFGNASWPDLIGILDRHCSADLQAWNKVWVNESSRPVFDYHLGTANGRISDFYITQRAEDGSSKTWPQVFALSLIYEDHTEAITVRMNSTLVHLPQLAGHPAPQAIVFNADGQGYGVFPRTPHTTDFIYQLPSSLMRATVYLNFYEGMLANQGIRPDSLLALYRKGLLQERDELALTLLLDQLNSVFWRFITPEERNKLAPSLEAALWAALAQNPAANQQKLLFKTYSAIALSKTAQDTLYQIWANKRPPAGVKLAEDDYTSLAAALSIRQYPGSDTIVQAQLHRIQNPDRQRRWQYVLPALSNDTAVRDRFFTSLHARENRTKEAWVVTALGYLHHPLRSRQSFKYLQPSLDLLETIQQTGDIFFPQNWLQATFNYYQTKAAGDVVRKFLQIHPQYNPKLRNKIWQAADPVFRAERLTTIGMRGN